jgi:hypothetical protein
MMAIVWETGISAHRRDEYLQAARIAIDPEALHIELDLTPAIGVAEAILADIDRNGDETLDQDEQLAYARVALSVLEVDVDGTPLRVRFGSASFPDAGSMRRGEGTIRLQSATSLPSLSAGAHQLSFRNGHHREGSVYLANALVPESDQVAVTAQRRDTDQRELIIEYVLRTPAPIAPMWLLSSVAAIAALLAPLFWRSSSVLRRCATLPPTILSRRR